MISSFQFFGFLHYGFVLMAIINHQNVDSVV